MSDSNKAIFLSYASQDAEAARRICDALRTAGVEVWFDQSELRGGDAWDQKIRRQIKECALFVPVISANTQARHEGYFRLEWHLAEQRSHLIARGRPFIVPVSIDQTNDANALVPDAFLAVQWMRVPGGETTPAFCDRVKKLLGGESDVGRGRLTPPQEPVAGSGDPAPQQRRSEPPSPSGSGAPRGAAAPKRVSLPLLVFGGMAFLVVCLMAYCVFKPRRSPEEIAKLIAQAKSLAEAAEAKSAVKDAPETKAAESPAATLSKAAAPAAPDSRSVAVLAFTNLSDDKENEYFSDGISEELLTVLQKIPGLHVAARTSAFSFKGKNATAQEIGQKLGVANLVEGSVRRAGNSLRITASLSRVDTGEQLWSESYTRELKDVFALQEELALAIVDELRGQLAGGESAAAVKAAVKGGTTNAEAYQQYLRGRFFLNKFEEKSNGEAERCFQRSVELDPAFALAWAGLARTHVWYCEYSSDVGREGFDTHLARAREAADRGLTLEPDLPEALLARAEIQYAIEFNWSGANETLLRARALAPADPALLTAAGQLAGSRGDMADSVALLRQAVALDPVSPEALGILAFHLVIAGQHAEARQLYQRVQEMNPTGPWAYAGVGLSFVLQGRYEDAVAATKPEAAEWAKLLIDSLAYWGGKKVPESDAALARLTTMGADTAAYQIAEAYGFRGEKDRAFEWLERARRQRDGGLILLRHDDLLASLRSDPRWPAFLRTIGLADDQLK